jgi:tetratricopeptide (TPR) repeat protein
VATYSDLGWSNRIVMSNTMLGFAKWHLGRYKGARTQGQLGLTLAREIGYRPGIAFSLLVLGCVSLAMEAHAEAIGLLEESVAVHREIGQQADLSEALAMLGVAARGLAQFPQAWDHLSEALRTAAETGAVFPLMFALPAVALLLADQGEKERAVELYALASRYPYVANSHGFEEATGRHIAAAVATLPPEVVAAAQERGRARDLDETVKELLVELEEKQGADAL